jgi:hypothetical protein
LSSLEQSEVDGGLVRAGVPSLLVAHLAGERAVAQDAQHSVRRPGGDAGGRDAVLVEGAGDGLCAVLEVDVLVEDAPYGGDGVRVCLELAVDVDPQPVPDSAGERDAAGDLGGVATVGAVDDGGALELGEHP